MIASQEETKYKNENYEFNKYGPKDGGAVKSDPVADTLIITPIAIGVAACVVYCAGGAAVSGVATGARWLWRAIRPERAVRSGPSGHRPCGEVTTILPADRFDDRTKG